MLEQSAPSAGRASRPTAPVLVEGGHYPLVPASSSRPAEVMGEPLELPDGQQCLALTTPTTRRCFAAAVAEALSLRARGLSASIGLLVGDMALRAGSRPAGGAWALPPSYRLILDGASVELGEVRVYGEAYARNQGKRRLLDPMLRRKLSPEASYRLQGWAFFHGGRDEVCLASDASLDWDGDVRVAMLTRGPAPLCPLIFAGLKRAIFQAGFCAHSAFYAIADDHLIDRKLQAAAAVVAQLREGRAGVQTDNMFLASLEDPGLQRSWQPDDLVVPGERTWTDFVAAVQEHHPDLTPLQPT